MQSAQNIKKRIQLNALARQKTGIGKLNKKIFMKSKSYLYTMHQKKLILVGGGGHCKSVIDKTECGAGKRPLMHNGCKCGNLSNDEWYEERVVNLPNNL